MSSRPFIDTYSHLRIELHPVGHTAPLLFQDYYIKNEDNITQDVYNEAHARFQTRDRVRGNGDIGSLTAGQEIAQTGFLLDGTPLTGRVVNMGSFPLPSSEALFRISRCIPFFGRSCFGH